MYSVILLVEIPYTLLRCTASAKMNQKADYSLYWFLSNVQYLLSSYSVSSS